jgi:hypothetical protein
MNVPEGSTGDLALRDMEAAMDTIAASRRAASEYRQMGFKALADYHRDNANGAERWLLRAAKAYPKRVNHLGNVISE